MTDDLDTRLKKALESRDKLAAEIQRIEGRKEAAQRSLTEVEEEIRSKNLDPNTIDKVVQDLRLAYEAEVSKLEQEVSKTRETLTPYLG
jgi:predicted  nucleic acid-binding Zn-ribbon protein